MSTQHLSLIEALPLEIKEQIAENLDFRSRIRFRRCSKLFRNISENKDKTYFKHVAFSMNTEENYLRTVILAREGEKRVAKSDRQKVDNLENLKLVLENPEAHFDKLELNLDPTKTSCISELQEMFRSLSMKIAIRRLEMDRRATQENILQVMSHLDPGVLESVYFGKIGEKMMLDEVKNLDQWKRLKRGVFLSETNLEIEDLLHFRRLSLYTEAVLTLETVEKLTDAAWSKIDDFEGVTIWYGTRSGDLDDYLQQFGEFVYNETKQTYLIEKREGTNCYLRVGFCSVFTIDKFPLDS